MRTASTPASRSRPPAELPIMTDGTARGTTGIGWNNSAKKKKNTMFSGGVSSEEDGTLNAYEHRRAPVAAYLFPGGPIDSSRSSMSTQNPPFSPSSRPNMKRKRTKLVRPSQGHGGRPSSTAAATLAIRISRCERTDRPRFRCIPRSGWGFRT